MNRGSGAEQEGGVGILPGSWARRVALLMGPRRRSTLVALAAVLAVGAAGCDRERCSTLDAGNVDECLRLNQIQTLGTHNSYHLQPSGGPQGGHGLHQPGVGRRALGSYDHRPLVEQLETAGIRQFELDVFHDSGRGGATSDRGRD